MGSCQHQTDVDDWLLLNIKSIPIVIIVSSNNNNPEANFIRVKQTMVRPFFTPQQFFFHFLATWILLSHGGEPREISARTSGCRAVPARYVRTAVKDPVRLDRESWHPHTRVTLKTIFQLSETKHLLRSLLPISREFIIRVKLHIFSDFNMLLLEYRQ